MTQILVIGGSDAGISAALRARELDPTSDVTIMLKDSYPNYSICGLPFYLSGEVADWRNLAHRTLSDLEGAGIRILANTVARAIDPVSKHVRAEGADRPVTMRYDELVIATGAEPVRPNLPGANLQGVFVLHDMDHARSLDSVLRRPGVRRAVIIGAGYIGCEMAESFARLGLQVTVLEQAPAVLPTVDVPLGNMLGSMLRERGVDVRTDIRVTGIGREQGSLQVHGDPDMSVPADIVLLVVGVRPQADLAKAVGIDVGIRGAIPVEQTMATSVPHIFAAGDCVETWHRLLARPAYIPLGTTAHKQGRVAGENALGGHRRFAGSVGTQVVKVFDAVVGRTGLNDKEAQREGFAPLTVACTAWDHKVYYPGATQLVMRLTGDRATRRLLGGQILGLRGGQVAKRIDILAAALFHGMTVDDLADLDLSYTPPLSSPWDPVQMAAEAWCRSADGNA